MSRIRSLLMDLIQVREAQKHADPDHPMTRQFKAYQILTVTHLIQKNIFDKMGNVPRRRRRRQKRPGRPGVAVEEEGGGGNPTRGRNCTYKMSGGILSGRYLFFSEILIIVYST